MVQPADVGVSLANLGRQIASASEGGGDSGASARAEERLQFTREDREIEREKRELDLSQRELRELTMSGMKDLVRIGEFVNSGSTDGTEFRNLLDSLAIGGSEGASPFSFEKIDQILSGPASDIMGRSAGLISKNIATGETYQRIFNKKGLHRLAAIKALRDFSSSSKGILTEQIDVKITEPDGVAQAEVNIIRDLSRFVAGEPGKPGSFESIKKTKTTDVLKSVIDPNTGFVKIVSADGRSATQAMMNILVNNNIKQTAFFGAQAKEGDDTGPYNAFLELDEQLEELKTQTSLFREAEEAVRKGTAESFEALEKSTVSRSAHLSESAQLSIAQDQRNLFDKSADIEAVLDDRKDKALTNFTKQIIVKSDILADIIHSYMRASDFWEARGGREAGTVGLSPQESTSLPAFLKDMPEGTFADNQISRTEMVAYFRQGLGVIASQGARENLGFSAMLEHMFGKKVGGGTAVESVTKYNTSVNKIFTDGVESLIKRMDEVKAGGSALSIVEARLAKLTADLGVAKIKVELDLRTKYPSLFRQKEINAALVSGAQVIYFKALAKATNNFSGPVNEMEKPEVSLRYDIGIRDGLDFALKGQSTSNDTVNELVGTMNEIRDIHIPHINRLYELAQAGDDDAERSLRSYKRTAGMYIVRAWNSGQTAVMKREKDITARLSKLEGGPEGEKPSDADDRAAKLLRRMNTLFHPDKDRLGGVLIKLGFTREVLTNLMTVYQQTQDVISGRAKERNQ